MSSERIIKHLSHLGSSASELDLTLLRVTVPERELSPFGPNGDVGHILRLAQNIQEEPTGCLQ